MSYIFLEIYELIKQTPSKMSDVGGLYSVINQFEFRGRQEREKECCGFYEYHYCLSISHKTSHFILGRMLLKCAKIPHESLRDLLALFLNDILQESLKLTWPISCLKTMQELQESREVCLDSLECGHVTAREVGTW